MPVRPLTVDLPWANALSRLTAKAGEVAFCWAAVRRAPAAAWELLGVTVRAGITVPPATYEYGELGLWSGMAGAVSVAAVLGQRERLTAGTRELEPIPESAGQAWWLTSGVNFGMVGPVSTPSYYFAVQLPEAGNRINDARLSAPAYGPRQPYYPSREHAVLDVLYGLTPDQGRRDLFNQVVIHLPYDRAYIESAEYVDGQGYVVRVGGATDASAAGHELQTLWKLHRSERSYQRAMAMLTERGSVTFDTGAEPVYFTASLQDASGQLVDSFERESRPLEQGPLAAPLPVEALPEAFDILGHVWRERTGHRLIQLRRLSPATQLGMAVTSRSDFQSRMIDVADVLDALTIDEALLEPGRSEGMKSLGRMKLALARMLRPPEVVSALAAVDVLQDIVRVRVAVAHAEAKPDLPTALRRLQIEYPIEWSKAWELIRVRVVAALRELRQALEAGAE